MTNKSCALFRAANIRILDYPFAAALASALSICDEAVIVVSNSYDDTADYVMEQQAIHGWNRVNVAYQKFVYDRGWQERWWNFAASQTDADWLMYIDADEVIHEDDAPTLRAIMNDSTVGLIRFDLCNFYGTPNYQTMAPLRQARLGRRSRGWRMENWCTDETPTWPACQMVYGGGVEAHSEYKGADIVGSFTLYHYGHCRDAYALAISTAKHHAWYADGDGLEDGRIPDVTPRDFDLPGKLANYIIRPYEGEPHPAVMNNWLSSHAEAWRELERTCLQPI